MGSEDETHYQKESCFNFIVVRLKGTVLRRIWGQILFMTAYSAFIVYLHKHVEGLQMNFPVSLISVMGGVTGLLLVFRTNTAYDRYWEGRKLWSSMTNHCRGLTLGIWVGLDGKYKKDFSKEMESNDIIERLSAINLLLAFVHAVKHYLRSEYSYNPPDMRDLVSHLSKFRLRASETTNNSNSQNHTNNTMGRAGDRAVDESLNTLLSVAKGQSGKTHVNVPKKIGRGHGVKAYDIVPPSNIPLEIIYHLYSFLQEVASKGPVEANVMRNLQGSVLSLVSCLTEFERILRTPMPMAYSLHLFCTVFIFLLATPFQFVGSLNWWTVPVVTLASFALLGILEIGLEIENPFGYDENDLPLDDFCKVIRREVEMITGHSTPGTASWIMSPHNCPMAPTSWLSAQELVRESGDEIKKLLARRADVPTTKL